MTEPPRPAAAPASGGESAALRAQGQRPGADGPLGSALRSALLRRAGEGHVTGLCAALARAGGLPVRLVRAAAIGLLGLGVGLPLYLLITLLIPRERVVAGPSGSELTLVDRPVRCLLRGRPGRGDLLLALVLLPAVVAAALWVWWFVLENPAPLRLLVPVELLLLVILAWGAVRARRARTAYLFAQLGRRAGLMDEDELARTVLELRRYAPRAWAAEGGGLDPAPSEAVGPSPGGARGRRRAARMLRPPTLSPRTTLAAAGLLLMLGTLTFIIVSVAPQLAPGLGTAPLLPGIGRLAVAAGAMTVTTGAMLVTVGLRRRRSLALALIGCLTLSVFGAGVVWVRMTDVSGSEPIVVQVEQYSPGAAVDCAPGGARSWNRPVVIDLSAVRMPAGGIAEVQRAWRQDNPGAPESGMDLSMVVSCDRPVGSVTVLLPPADAGIAVHSALTSSFGAVHGTTPASGIVWTPRVPSIELSGQLGAGDITYRQGGR